MRGMSLYLGYVEFAMSLKYLGDTNTEQEKPSSGTVEVGLPIYLELVTI